MTWHSACGRRSCLSPPISPVMCATVTAVVWTPIGCQSARHGALLKTSSPTPNWTQVPETEHDPRPQAIIVAHSMGTLVAQYFLECMAGADVTLTHVAVGPPFRGSVLGMFLFP